MKNIFKGLVILVLLALIGVLLYATRMNKTAKPTQPVTVNTVQQLDQVVQQIDGYYVNPNEKSFLREEPIADDELTQLKEAIDTVNASTADKNKVLVEIEIVEWKKAALDAVNHLYSGSATPVIKGDQVATKKVLADNLKLVDVEKVATDFIDTMPKRLLLDDEEVPEDKFNTAITELINEAKGQFENFDKALEALNKVEAIDIEDGQIGNIAKALRDFEKLRDKVTDDNLLKQLNEKADQYLSVFLKAFTEIASEIPGYYDIALVAAEPSQLLTKLMKENRETLEATETETETTEEVVTEEIVTEESRYVPEPSYTEPPVTVPPVTEPPTTAPPVTEPPVTEPPVTEPPTTAEPTPEPPVSSDQTE
ncbi:hypothetical protein [Globicatella sanguinis]